MSFDVTHLIRSAVIVVVAAGALGLAYLIWNNYSILQKQQLKNQALHDCAIDNQVKVTDPTAGNGMVSVWSKPMEEFYRLCVEDKGYTTAVKVK